MMEVGDLSGVEADAFQSALELVVRDTILEKASVNLVRIPGKGKCHTCNIEFKMKTRVDTCPECQCFPSVITGGDEFRIVSLTAY
jgi:hydrogenase nickel incorporation protein HypA/HybF